MPLGVDVVFEHEPYAAESLSLSLSLCLCVSLNTRIQFSPFADLHRCILQLAVAEADGCRDQAYTPHQAQEELQLDKAGGSDVGLWFGRL